MAKKKLAATPSVEMVWSGEVGEDFRKTADTFLKTPLSDEAWEALRGVVRRYSMSLNHEIAAEDLTQQTKAVKAVLSSTAILLKNIEAADTLPMGLVVTNRLPNIWDELRGTQSAGDEAEAQVAKSIADMFEENGLTDPDDVAGTMAANWREQGLLREHETLFQFRDMLADFEQVTAVFLSRLQDRTERHVVADTAWTLLAGELKEWAEQFGIKPGVSKNPESGPGALLHLTKAINELPPMLKDADGSLSSKQMRRPVILDESLSDSIINAREAYKRAKARLAKDH